MKPNRIFLVRHGESEGNIDDSIYNHTPDWKINLTPLGEKQACIAGDILSQKILFDVKFNTKIYVSPFYRTRQTARYIVLKLTQSDIDVVVTEDPRLREQEWGNYQEDHLSKKIDDERDNFGTFFYRMPNGESGADVFDRISTFFETLYRDFKKPDYPSSIIIVTHGLALRLFLMRWFHWSVEEFESLKNPDNCDIIEMRLEVNSDKYEIINKLKKDGE